MARRSHLPEHYLELWGVIFKILTHPYHLSDMRRHKTSACRRSTVKRNSLIIHYRIFASCDIVCRFKGETLNVSRTNVASSHLVYVLSY